MKNAFAERVRSLPVGIDLTTVIAVIAAIGVSIAIVRQSFVALAGLAVIGLAVLFPVEASLGLFAILVPFDQVLVFGNSDFTFSWFSGAFAGATLMLYGAMTGRFKTPARSGFYWSVFVFWTIISLAWAIEPSVSMTRLPTVVALFGMYIVAANFEITKQELSRVLLLAVVGGVIASGFIVFQYAHNISFEGRASLTVGESEANPNELAASLLLPASLAFCGILSGPSRLKKLGLIGALALITTSIFLTMSRGSLIALAATLLPCLFLLRSGMRKRLLLVSVLALPLLFLPNLFYERVGQALSNRGTGRYDIWIAGLQIVKNNPVIGVGLANFPVAYMKFAGYAPVFPSHGYIREAHDAYLQVCAETGAIGLLLFLVAMIVQIKESRSPRANNDPGGNALVALQAACFGQLVAALSGNIQWNKSFWLVFILLALVSQHREEEVESRPLAFNLRSQASY